MGNRLKTFWLNIDFVDRDMDLSERRQISSALAKQNVEVRANFNYIKTPLAVTGLNKVWMLRLRTGGLFGRFLLFLEQQILLLKNLDVDVVVLNPFNFHQTLPLWIFWRKIFRRRKPKFVLDIRTLPVDNPKNARGKLRKIRFDTSIRLSFRHFDGLTIITEKMKKDLQTKFQNFQKNICIWSSGVDTSLFDPNNAGDIREKFRLNGRFVIMHHGIFSPNRGLQEAIEAIALICKKHPEILLFLLGKGPAKKELEEKVRNYGLEDHVIIHPPVPFEEVPKFIKSAQVGILPFPNLDWWNTSSPIKLNEYLSIGKPVIVTDIAAHRAVLGKMECGFFVRDHQPASIAYGMKTAINRASELESLGKIARNIAIKNYTWEKQAKKIKKYFQELLTEG